VEQSRLTVGFEDSTALATRAGNCIDYGVQVHILKKATVRRFEEILLLWLKHIIAEGILVLDSSNSSTPTLGIEDKINQILQGQHSIIRAQNELRESVVKALRSTSVDDQQSLNKILVAVEQGRVEQAQIAEVVGSLRRWAINLQSDAFSLPTEVKGMVDVLKQLSQTPPQDELGMYQYIALTLPIIPGILSYNVEVGSDHRANLHEIWKTLQGLVEQSNSSSKGAYHE
jgi:hypothetical protein